LGGSTSVGVAALEAGEAVLAAGVTRAPQLGQNSAPASSGESQVVQFIGGSFIELQIADCVPGAGCRVPGAASRHSSLVTGSRF
jgi:hypothetical protein